MGKTNIAELLKDCPSGMELNCTMFDDNCMEFNDIVDNKFLPIRCRVKQSNGEYNFYNFTKYGCWIDDDKAKCVIFPKDKTTWEGFHRPFKDGDILIHGDCTFIYNGFENDMNYGTYVIIDCYGAFAVNISTKKYGTRFTTKEEKQKLFDAIKANGYKWNPETKTLEKLLKFKIGDKIKKKNSDNVHILEITAITPKTYIFRDGSFQYVEIVDKDYELINEPKFKVGDRITNGKIFITIGYIDNEYYYEISRNIANRLFIKNQDEWNLVSNKFDINTLIPFESRVLVRNKDCYEWEGAVFGRYDGDKFFTIGGISWKYCIPYEGNEHLFGTINDCDDFYKIWEE